MASTNKKKPAIFTAEGGQASHANPEQMLRRSVMSCLLFEKEFYEDGITIADRIAQLVPLVAPETVSEIAVEARHLMHLRHAPLALVREMARHPNHKPLVAKTLKRVIARADELTEFVALYWKDKRQPLSAQVKKGLAAAFHQFTEYELAKYNRDKAVKLRDVLMLCHPKPDGPEQAELWKRLLEDKLAVPDTWEVALSSGADKRGTWMRLIEERKLGGLALLRNLRNMVQASVPEPFIRDAIKLMRTDRILPFRFVAASRWVPQFEPELEQKMLEAVADAPKLLGPTVVLVDVSGSMRDVLSAKSDMRRMDAACALAMLVREVCGEVRIFSFSQTAKEVAPRRGFALRDAIITSQPHGGTYLGGALAEVYKKTEAARFIVVTDEQIADRMPAPKGFGYIINIASNCNGVGYGSWTKIDGWSEAVVRYISESER